MKRLHLFILKSYLGPFVIAFTIAMMFLVMQFLWKYVDDLMGKGLELTTLLELLFYVSFTLVPLALPIGILFSSLMTLGNLAEHNELTAMKSAGLSLFRILRPMFIFVLLVSALAFYFTNFVLPIAALKQKTILANIIQKKPTFGITPGVFYNDIENYSIKIDEKNDNTGDLKKILIYELITESGRIPKIRTIKAKSGQMLKSDNGRFLILKLIKGSIYEQSFVAGKLGESKHPFNKSFFEEAIIKIDLSGFGMPGHEEELFKQDHQMMNFVQLQKGMDSLYTAEDSVNQRFVNRFKENILILNPNYGQIQIADNDTLIKVEKEPELVKTDTVFHLDSLSKMQLKEAFLAAQSKIRGSKQSVRVQTITSESFQDDIRNFRMEWHRKFTLSIVLIILFFIGAPLGAIIKKGGLGTPLVVAVLFFILYYVIMISGENMIESDTMDAATGMWLSSIILAPVSVFVTYKAVNDSKIFEPDAYKKLIRRFARFIRSIFSRNQDANSSNLS